MIGPNIKRFLAVAVAVWTTMTGAGLAEAGCFKDGKVAYTRLEAHSQTMRVYLQPSPASDTGKMAPSHFYYFDTADAQIQTQVGLAQVSNFAVEIFGTAESCGLEGTYREGGRLKTVSLVTSGFSRLEP